MLGKKLSNYLKYTPAQFLDSLVKHTQFLYSDELFLKLRYRCNMGCWPDLKHPKKFTEKMQWLKLYDRKDEYTKLVDKITVKQFVGSVISKDIIIPTLGVWNNFDDIDFNILPNEFVLKTNHSGGSTGVVICKDKTNFDINHARKLLNSSLKSNSYYTTKEWPYKNVKPQILAETLLHSDNGKDLADYKFFCFHGVPRMMFIASDRTDSRKETKFDFYDMEFHHLPFINGHPNSTEPIAKPTKFDEMVRLSKILSKNIPHVRVDFYEANNMVYFGELTFYHYSGWVPFKPAVWDRIIGDWLQLPTIENDY